MVLGTFAALTMLRSLGAFGLLSPAPLIATATLIGLAFALGGQRSAGAVHRRRLSAPQVLHILGVALAAVTVGALFIQAWLYRTTAWDALWYHAMITHGYVAQGSTEWLETGVEYASGYPNAVELLAAWPCTVIGTTTFDDVGQIPFGVAGAALVHAWARRAGARVGTASILAVVWMWMPPVLLQLTADLNDVAEAVSLAATLWYLVVARETRGRSWWVLMSAALAFAAKGSGIVMLAPLGIFLAWDQIRSAWRHRPGFELPVRTALIVGVGLYKPIENWLRTGNPFWPLQTRVLGLAFEGPVDPASFTWNGMHGLDCFFFTGEGDFVRMISSWYDLSPGYEPNITSGGFGPVHAFLGVPAIALSIAAMAWRRIGRANRKPLLAALGLFVLGLMGPNPWWPRHVLAASVASAVILAAMLGKAPRRLDVSASLVALALALLAGHRAVSLGLESYRDHGLTAVVAMLPEERAALPVGLLWPAEVIEERDRAFGPDDVLAYEQSVWLHAQFVPWNYRSRIAWLEPEGSGEAYLARLQAAGARWVVLRSPRYRRELVRLGGDERWVHGDEAIIVLPTEARPVTHEHESESAVGSF